MHSMQINHDYYIIDHINKGDEHSTTLMPFQT